MRRLVGAVIIIVALLSAAVAQSIPSAGAEIRRAFSGRTMSGTEKGERYSERLMPDGYIIGTASGEQYEGEWSVDGDEICFEYEDEPEDCSQVIVKGNSVTFLGEGGRNTKATLR